MGFLPAQPISWLAPTVDRHPVGYVKNGFPNGSTSASIAMTAFAANGSQDLTPFSPVYCSEAGTYTLRYQITSYTSGTIQEAIFKFKDDFAGVGETILNQNWASPSVSTRALTGIVLDRGWFWVCLRLSNGGSASTTSSNNTLTSNGQARLDFSFIFPLKAVNGLSQTQSYFYHSSYSLWDNAGSSGAGAWLLSNGTLSDFSPFQNLTPSSDKFLFPNSSPNSIPKISLERTA